MGLSENRWFSEPHIIDGTPEIITIVPPSLMLNQDDIHLFVIFDDIQ